MVADRLAFLETATAAPTAPRPRPPPLKPGAAQEEDTENASNILRRLSSPIFSTSGFSFNSDSDADNDNDQSLFFDDDKKNEGAETIQRWWQKVRQTCRRAKAAVAAKPAFERIQKFLDKVCTHTLDTIVLPPPPPLDKHVFK